MIFGVILGESSRVVCIFRCEFFVTDNAAARKLWDTAITGATPTDCEPESFVCGGVQSLQDVGLLCQV